MLVYDLPQLPRVEMTGKVQEKSGWSHSGRCAGQNILIVINRGECTFTIGEVSYAYKKGDIALVPRGTIYYPNTATFCEYTFFRFDGDLLPCTLDLSIDHPFADVSHTMSSYGTIKEEESTLFFDYKMSLGDRAQNIDLFLRKCADTQLKYTKRMHLLLSVQFSEMLYFISESYCTQFATEDGLPLPVRRILQYIRENYTHTVTLDAICQSAGLSKQYAMRVFKKHMHTTINHYILELRMRHAAYLLRSTYMNIGQTADYLGFSNANYFSNVFKKYFGVSPSEYSEE